MTFRATYFVQMCPTCGRQLRVRVEYLGRDVRCQHCSAHFIARDPATPETAGLMDTADRLLAQAAERLSAGVPPRVGPVEQFPFL